MPEDKRGRETPFVVFYSGGRQFGFGVRIDDVESFGVTEAHAEGFHKTCYFRELSTVKQLH